MVEQSESINNQCAPVDIQLFAVWRMSPHLRYILRLNHVADTAAAGSNHPSIVSYKYQNRVLIAHRFISNSRSTMDLPAYWRRCNPASGWWWVEGVHCWLSGIGLVLIHHELFVGGAVTLPVVGDGRRAAQCWLAGVGPVSVRHEVFVGKQSTTHALPCTHDDLSLSDLHTHSTCSLNHICAGEDYI